MLSGEAPGCKQDFEGKSLIVALPVAKLSDGIRTPSAAPMSGRAGMQGKEPLYRGVNTQTRGVRHGNGGDDVAENAVP